MKGFWFGVALVVMTLLLGCSDRAPENTQNLEQNAPATGPGAANEAAQPVPQENAPAATVPSSRRDGSAGRTASNPPAASAPTTGTAGNAARPPAAAPTAPPAA